ncbi:DNA-directed RNA polymerase subunit beta' [Candidatus Falkowbacteria bacterium RIFOXYB2_FULL_47_14]|uniref:DNA-directed RNA polymerase subunit beta' n=1 Tax=Candidatus Falkowbacteria bacterium RIFOXYA2_FULL_47_19 TaxID=1797994 RepID=A0A1F5SEN1_9BACT|nr:MAG: DNA-directed RNA polymerase subunit beta' [Candidatus Falkowbacteria bacterium RIFOXYA2_FULL_47_19]OGF35273.1 MAG: DNA-directed RNA polymerase subunit beta' [Candidatus Falkowbacteria bacterium RIFOXYC2_FULL_46_15]OGF43915.1 MAG: DNA-directed RNA polymerase subunit beta' [Candidatus Falkowbacteria bacterium RIFOXYB2_FULL_47_14]
MLNPIKTTDFDAIKLKLASPEEIMSWSKGEVTRPETINYRTQKPEKDGLFCEKIFGPSKDWECYCGKYKKIRYKGIVCDKCGVEVTRSIVRRERMGHIKLETPCTHIWFLRGLSSKVGLLLGLSMQALEKVVYFASFIVTAVNEELKEATIEQINTEYKQKKKAIESEFSRLTGEIKSRRGKLLAEGKGEGEVEGEIESETASLDKVKQEKLANLNNAFDQAQRELKELKPLLIISESTYQNLSLKYGHIFEAGIGAEAIRKLLEEIDIEKTIKRLEGKLKDCLDSKRDKIVRRLKLFKSLRANSIRPEWMILAVIPVIPPDLRPMVALDGGRFATSDLNDLYRRVINRNNRLKQLIDLSAPEVICRNEKRMLQEAVDALIDNSARHGKTVIASTGQKRMLKSLADSLKGKQGRFRQNLLGKRIDYSGRSVIVVNPRLRLNECGLPKVMALELFKPFIISRLIKNEVVHNVRSASRFIEAGADEVWDILEDIIKEAYVLLNRAPTLHRLGIQAFKPILIEGKAIQIHPMVCTAFNADFDGDQMAVHVPLTKEAVTEARDIMLSSRNLLKPATGDPVVAPSQDIVWGAFYITSGPDMTKEEVLEKIDHKSLKSFSSEADAKLAYESGLIKLHDPIRVLLDKRGLTTTTVGRVIFNDILPEKLRFVNSVVGKSKLVGLVKACFRHYGRELTVTFLDEIKERSFSYITKSGLSWGMGDLPDFKEKDVLISETQTKVEEIQEQYEEGLLTDTERYAKVIELWTSAKEKVTDICKKKLPTEGPLYSMIESGARGSWAQLTQILGMKGLVTSPSGDIIELPVKGNFKRGFEVLEYFISTHGVRKGLSDTALRTANAGYLTRRLVDVSQDVIITQDDCADEDGLVVTKKEGDAIGVSMANRILGRYLAADLKNAKGKILVKAGELITEDIADEIRNEDIEEARIRSVLSCKLHRGVCVKCYGWDLGFNKPVKMGTAVGIIAAQSIGEPGTQLTMRTFHTGGIAGVEDITQGLPRVEEIFEARPPKRKAFISDVAGIARIETTQRTIEDSSGKVLMTNPQAKILKIVYDGTTTDKYYFSDTGKEDDGGKKKKEAKAPKPEIKLYVKDGEAIEDGGKLFKINNKVVKAEKGGVVKIENKYVKVKVNAKKTKEFIVPKGMAIIVKEGGAIEKGEQLTDGSLDLQQLFKLRGKSDTQKYIIKEIQSVYSSQGQPLNDKHIEIIAKQMFSRYFIHDAGSTDLLPGEIVESAVVARANEKIDQKNGDKEAAIERLLLGITKASLTTDSFLSAASFQETARVLIEAAVNGKIDYLEGLKENVIIGRLIPAGTGYKGKQERAVY